MDWSPKRLTRTQMEERRREGAKLIKAGKLSHTAIAQRLGVSGAAVGQWAKYLAQGGVRSLRHRIAPGRPARLTEAQKRVLRRRLKRGALAAGFPTDRWTMGRVCQLIEREFSVRYHVKYIKQPLPQAAERDEDLIRAWLAQDWPRIKKGAAARRKHSVL